jgi:hypothetical protein
MFVARCGRIALTELEVFESREHDGFMLYVFNDVTSLWDRLRPEQVESEMRDLLRENVMLRAQIEELVQKAKESDAES